MTEVRPQHCTEVRYVGAVYCPTTETGYWLVRYGGAIHVTGNTGRWSGTGGINFQNFGARDVHDLIKQVGQMLTAPEGYVFGTGDLSQIEARVVAWFAGQEDLLEAFAQGRDIYSEFAQEQIYHKETRKPRKDDPPKLAKALTTRRNVGKETILGAGFGMGGNTFYERCKQKPSLKEALASGELTFELCQRAIAVYRKRFSLIPVFWRELEKAWRFVARYKDQQATVSHQGRTLRFWNEGGTVVIQLPSSRCLFYPHAAVSPDDICRYRWGHVYGGSLTENVVQATARDIFALGLLRMEDAGMNTLFSVHDQAVNLVPRQNIHQLAEMHALQCVLPPWAEGLPVATEGDLTKAYHKT
ncbi:MAG: DNA polymerase [Phycisphaerales bacterium]